MSHAKQQGAGVMRVSSFDRSNWAKMASAAKGAGLESVAKKFGAAACLPVGAEIPLSVFDQLQSEWRDWLVSGKFRHGVTVHPVARAVRAESMPVVDIDRLDAAERLNNAAPELLAALEKWEQWAAHYRTAPIALPIGQISAQGRAAIAKAKGF